jgi:two-component sensor histidine kinase
MRAALKEKDAVLKEIHHRVKNDLQLISSLLALQSRSIADSEVRGAFSASQNRIHCVALLHDCLYTSGEFSKVDLSQYVTELAGNLFRAQGVASGRIVLTMDLDKIPLPVDRAAPCGIIINELVSNSLKHAFPEDRQGEVRIDLRGQPGNMVRLVVADNGVGLARGVDWRNSRSLGFRLVRSLCKQLGATIDVRSQEGTQVHLTFPVI